MIDLHNFEKFSKKSVKKEEEKFQLGVNSEIDEATEEKPVLIPLLRKRKRSKQKAYSDEDDEDTHIQTDIHTDKNPYYFVVLI